nr:uncharacterized protein LOC112007459 [Quercus suber]
MLEHIKHVKTPKEAWDTFSTLFSKKNDVRLQLLENKLMSVAQQDMTITQYFTKVLRIEMMKIEKIRRALKIEELKEVATIMIDDPRVTEIVMSSVSSVKKWATLHETVDTSGEQLKEIQ